MFMFYLCTCLRIYVFFVGEDLILCKSRKVRPYFGTRVKNINRNINNTQTRTQTHFVTCFAFVHVYGLCFLMLGKE